MSHEQNLHRPTRGKDVMRGIVTAIVILAVIVMLAVGGTLIVRDLAQPGPAAAAAQPAPLPDQTWSVDVDDLPPLPTASTTPADEVGGDSARRSQAQPDQAGHPSSSGVVSNPLSPGASTPSVSWPAPARSSTNMLTIPALGVSTKLGTTTARDGAMVIPDNVREVVRLDTTAALDAKEGSTVVAGHVNSRIQGKGTLWDLYRIPKGSQIWTTDAQGRATQWRVTSLNYVKKSALPDELFATTGARRLVLITCGGQILTTPQGRHYESNVIAVATPVR